MNAERMEQLIDEIVDTVLAKHGSVYCVQDQFELAKSLPDLEAVIQELHDGGMSDHRIIDEMDRCTHAVKLPGYALTIGQEGKVSKRHSDDLRRKMRTVARKRIYVARKMEHFSKDKP